MPRVPKYNLKGHFIGTRRNPQPPDHVHHVYTKLSREEKKALFRAKRVRGAERTGTLLVTKPGGAKKIPLSDAELMLLGKLWKPSIFRMASTSVHSKPSLVSLGFARSQIFCACELLRYYFGRRSVAFGLRFAASLLLRIPDMCYETDFSFKNRRSSRFSTSFRWRRVGFSKKTFPFQFLPDQQTGRGAEIFRSYRARALFDRLQKLNSDRSVDYHLAELTKTCETFCKLGSEDAAYCIASLLIRRTHGDRWIRCFFEHGLLNAFRKYNVQAPLFQRHEIIRSHEALAKIQPTRWKLVCPELVILALQLVDEKRNEYKSQPVLSTAETDSDAPYELPSINESDFSLETLSSWMGSFARRVGPELLLIPEFLLRYPSLRAPERITKKVVQQVVVEATCRSGAPWASKNDYQIDFPALLKRTLLFLIEGEPDPPLVPCTSAENRLSNSLSMDDAVTLNMISRCEQAGLAECQRLLLELAQKQSPSSI